MAENATSPESLADDFQDGNSSPLSSSRSNDGRPVESKAYRLFGRDKLADIFLWRNKKSSGIVFGIGTALWLSFEFLEYHLITLVCHLLIVALAITFLCSSVPVLAHKFPVHITEVSASEECLLEVATALRTEINSTLVVLREIATGNDVKKFLRVTTGLWIVSVIGNWFNILTLFYIAFLSLFTMPLLYEKYEDQVDSFAEKAMVEMKQQYANFDAKVLSKTPIGGMKKD